MDELTQVRTLSERLVEAQSGIRILDAIKWDDGIRAAFLADGCARQPPVDRAYYARRPLGFEPDEVRARLTGIEADLGRTLGPTHPAARLMTQMCTEYRLVLDMLEARGTPRFAALAGGLYGRSSDPFHTDGPSVADLGILLNDALISIDAGMFLESDPKNLSADDGAALLRERLRPLFAGAAADICVRISDDIVADAAAGADYIKLRSDAFFSARELRALEVHEGWVHVATTLNGRAQPWCTFLSKGTPSTTVTQEGLAFFVEIVSFSSHPARIRRVADRIRCINAAEHGATFLDVFVMLVEEGRTREDAYATAVRVFRGSTPDGGPFTKDLAYGKGFVQIYNFMRLAVKRGRIDMIPLLFCGKLRLEQIGVLAELRDRGLLGEPKLLPPQFADLNALTAWMTFSNFFNRIDLPLVERDLAAIFATV